MCLPCKCNLILENRHYRTAFIFEQLSLNYLKTLKVDVLYQ